MKGSVVIPITNCRYNVQTQITSLYKLVVINKDNSTINHLWSQFCDNIGSRADICQKPTMSVLLWKTCIFLCLEAVRPSPLCMHTVRGNRNRHAVLHMCTRLNYILYTKMMSIYHCKKWTVLLTCFGYLSFMPLSCTTEHEGVLLTVLRSKW